MSKWINKVVFSFFVFPRTRCLNDSQWAIRHFLAYERRNCFYSLCQNVAAKSNIHSSSQHLFALKVSAQLKRCATSNRPIGQQRRISQPLLYAQAYVRFHYFCLACGYMFIDFFYAFDWSKEMEIHGRHYSCLICSGSQTVV